MNPMQTRPEPTQTLSQKTFNAKAVSARESETLQNLLQGSGRLFFLIWENRSKWKLEQTNIGGKSLMQNCLQFLKNNFLSRP